MWSRGRADFSHMWTPREVQLCSRIRRCCGCCCCGLCPGLGTASSCIIQQNSEWLFFMGLFISFDHLFQVALSLCLPPPSHYLFFVFFFFVLFIIFIQFPVACARNDSESTVTQKSSSNAPAVSRGQSRRVEAALAMCCCCCHVRCLLNQKLRTFDQPHMTAPPSLQVTPVSPFLSSQQIETNPHPFVESGNASFDFILCAQSGQQKTNKKKK